METLYKTESIWLKEKEQKILDMCGQTAQFTQEESECLPFGLPLSSVFKEPDQVSAVQQQVFSPTAPDFPILTTKNSANLSSSPSPRAHLETPVQQPKTVQGHVRIDMQCPLFLPAYMSLKQQYSIYDYAKRCDKAIRMNGH